MKGYARPATGSRLRMTYANRSQERFDSAEMLTGPPLASLAMVSANWQHVAPRLGFGRAGANFDA
jgi:hypothetical protein